MAYTESQLQCLAGMGLVPWVLRDDIAQAQSQAVAVQAQTDAPAKTNAPAIAETSKAEQASELAPSSIQSPQAEAVAAIPSVGIGLTSEDDFLQTPLVAIPFRGRFCTQLGNPDASFLILVEAISNQQAQYPFEPSDAKIFEDMLRAIAWRRQDVCLAVLPPSKQASLVPSDQSATVAELCRVPRDAVLLFRHELSETLNPEELLVPMKNDRLHAWQLPHPALLRESPNRKRQAWEVLKAARARLS